MYRQTLITEPVVRRGKRGGGSVSLLLALLVLALTGRAAHAQIYDHPDPASGRTFYPVMRAHLIDSFTPNAVWSGEARRAGQDAVPGLLRFAAVNNGGNVTLDLRPFATVRTGETFVQVLTSPSPTLVIQIPGSAKVPAVYSPASFSQFGAANIRAHWSVLGYQPGSTFTLTLSVQCRNAAGQFVTHQDRWTWKVVATPESLRALLVALHGHTLGTAGISVIPNESAYAALLTATERIQSRIRSGDTANAKASIDAMDALVASYAGSGIIVTNENPADAWIRVELEYLRSQLP